MIFRSIADTLNDFEFDTTQARVCQKLVDSMPTAQALCGCDQGQRLPNEGDPNGYADKFTVEGIKLLDETLRRTSPWLGIKPTEKRATLTKIQNNVDDITSSLMGVSTEDEHDFVSPYERKPSN